MVVPVIRSLSLGLLLAPILLLSLTAHAQSVRGLSDLIAGWASGSLRSPVSCEIDGKMRRGVRRVIIEPVVQPGRPSELRVKFVDLHVGGATRCVDSLGRALPNVVGTVLARYPGRPHPETAKRDFREAMKRKKGFQLDVKEGLLKIVPVGSAAGPGDTVDFKQGELEISLVYPATDAARELAPFQSGRKMVLTLQSPSGEKLSLPLFDPAAR